MKNNLTVYQSVITDIKNIINAGQREAYGAASKAVFQKILPIFP